jgi:hypothetical protein
MLLFSFGVFLPHFRSYLAVSRSVSLKITERILSVNRLSNLCKTYVWFRAKWAGGFLKLGQRVKVVLQAEAVGEQKA